MSSRLAAVTAESNADKPTEHAQKKVTPSRTVSPPPPRDETVTKGGSQIKDFKTCIFFKCIGGF